MIDKSLQDNEDRVRRMLREAFVDVPCPEAFKETTSCGPVTHEVGLELRKSFYDYEPDEIQYMLPSILEDLMNTRTGDDIETENAEYLIMQLCPLNSESDVVRQVQVSQFAHFTKAQSQSIYEWLRLARTWKDLALYQDCVDAAIDYWCSRASE